MEDGGTALYAGGETTSADGVGEWNPGEKKKAGGVVKLGVRADKGAGPLASAGACVQEMEDELRSLEEWKEARATRLRSMERRYMGEIEEMYEVRGNAEEGGSLAGCCASGGTTEQEEDEMRRALQRLTEGVHEIAERQEHAAERLKREATAVRHEHQLTDGELRLLTANSTATSTARMHSGVAVAPSQAKITSGAVHTDDDDDDDGACSISDDEDVLGLDGIEDSLTSHLAEMDAVLAQMDLLREDRKASDAAPENIREA